VLYVVDKSGTVMARPVETGPLMGNLRVIRSGIARGDQVIIDGLQRARPGAKVAPKQGRIQAQPGPAGAPPSSSAPPAATAQPAGR
jgi:hypothetical protein